MSFKALLATPIALIALNASAAGPAAGNPPANANEKFEKAKQETLTHLDARIQAMTEAKTCVSAATDMPSLKKCHMALREEGRGMRDEMREKRKQRIDEQMKQLEEEKAKLEAEQKKK